jgi:hypothetical protein
MTLSKSIIKLTFISKTSKYIESLQSSLIIDSCYFFFIINIKYMLQFSRFFNYQSHYSKYILLFISKLHIIWVLVQNKLFLWETKQFKFSVLKKDLSFLRFIHISDRTSYLKNALNYYLVHSSKLNMIHI